MYLVMGITGKVGGATARHLLKQGKQVRALVRNRGKAAKWADRGVELVDGDWNDATAIAFLLLKGVEGAFVMLPPVCGHPRLIGSRQSGVDRELCRRAHQGRPTAGGGSALVDGCEQNKRDGDGHGLIAFRAGFSQPAISGRICARGRLFRKLSFRLRGQPGRNTAGLLQSDKPEIDNGRVRRHRRRGGNAS